MLLKYWQESRQQESERFWEDRAKGDDTSRGDAQPNRNKSITPCDGTAKRDAHPRKKKIATPCDGKAMRDAQPRKKKSGISCNGKA